jgi:drug/metabolite transporter (DMT)-like permease
MTLHSHPILWCLLSAFLFGISPALSKWTLGSLGPVTLAALLYLGAGLATLPFSRRPHIQGKKEWIRIGGAVFFGGVMGPIFLMYGIQEVGAARSALLLNFESVATVFLGWFFFREHISKMILFSVLLVTSAGILLSVSESQDKFLIDQGSIWVVLACFCWGLDNHYTALIEQLTPTQSTCIKGISAGIINLTIAYGLHETVGITEVLPFVIIALLIGALCYGASIVLYIASAQQIGATRAQLIFASAPYWGIICATLFLDETLTILHLFATGVMLIALWLQNKENHGHKHTHKVHTHTHWHRHDEAHHEHLHHEKVSLLWGWHIHKHEHESCEHSHNHTADLHHRHH